MCELLLKNILNGVLSTEIIVKWLKNEQLEDNVCKTIENHECNQAEFVLFFLNYLHEETSGILQSFSTQATPHRIRTPRRINSFSKSKNVTNKSNSRRAALFPDKNNSQNDLLGVSAFENNSRNNSQMTSTPRAKNRQSLPHDLDKDAVALSPIYKKNGFSKSITPKSKLETSSLCLGDFLVRKTNTKKKYQKNVSRETDDSFKNIENCLNQSNVESFDSSVEFRKTDSLKVRRRINPTNLSDSFSSKRIDSGNSFSFQINETEVTNNNSERGALLEERLKILSRPKENENLLLTPRQVRSQTIIKPNLDSVTFKSQLDILAEIYSTLFDLNLVLNALSEIYFLLTLVLLQVHNNTDQKIEELRATLKSSLTDLTESVETFEDIFKSVHNCVYFAARVLSKQSYLLSALDRASLKLLEENTRLRIFAPSLTKELVVYRGQKLEKKDSYSISGGENVSFISDTDNRENFPSDSCFHTFRKQRDLFYELLQIWESNHLQSGWNFSAALGSKIRSLIFMHTDPINSIHLARLFKNQLLAETSSSDTAPLPSCLTNIDAGKLNKLRDRLVSKKSTGGPSPEPTFPGRQEFFKDFILTSCSPGFHRHLIDCFVADISQLDDILIIDTDDTDAVVDQGTKTIFVNSLKSLKVLAKFLGFLDSLPYKTEVAPNHQILTSQISLRKHFKPSIDILTRIVTALENSKLLLTIPWIADYLAMMDHITLRLPYFSNLIENLFEIHYNCSKFFSQLEKMLMIKLCLGWLFERPNFPLDTYQSWISKKYLQNTCTEINLKNNSRIDHLDLIDESVLFICCPYLYEIRNFLSSDSTSNFNKGPIKYIRPISTVVESADVSNKKIQKQLEDAFFHNQPSSTKKTIDLVGERVASACAKYICHNLVPNTKLKSVEEFENHLKHISCLDQEKILEQFSICCMKKAKDLSDKCFEDFKKSSKEEIKHYTKVRCENSLVSLLADDIHPIARKTCISIAIHQSIERIEQWFSSHINPGIFLKEFVAEMDNLKQSSAQSSKKITYKLPAKGKNVDHDPEVTSPVTLMTEIRELMYIAHESPENIHLESLEQNIINSKDTCRKRCDMNQVAQFTICRMFFDLFFMLATNRPDLASQSSYLDLLISFWDSHLHKSERECFFDRIFCPRNAAMFEKSNQPAKTWHACELLVVKLMRSKFLKPSNFEKQTIAMFRYDWPGNMLKHFTSCVQNVVDDYVRAHGRQENFTFILSWIADYCNDEEFF